MGRPAKHGSKKWIELNDINSKESKKTQLKSTRTKKIPKKKVQLMIPSQINNFSVSNLEMSDRLLVRKIKKIRSDQLSENFLSYLLGRKVLYKMSIIKNTTSLGSNLYLGTEKPD